MKYYKRYMDRQTVSLQVHGTLLGLQTQKKSSNHVWKKYGVLAACAGLILGISLWGLRSMPEKVPAAIDNVPRDCLLQTNVGDTSDIDTYHFVVSGPETMDQALDLYYIPAIYYKEVADAFMVDSARRAQEPGEFWISLKKPDIQRIFWDTDRSPEGVDSDLPWALFWTGYALSGRADYNGQGELRELCLFGEKGDASFTLSMSPGRIPSYGCIPIEQDETSQVFGVEVSGWSRRSEQDGVTTYVCGSEFMAGETGVRFENRSSGDCLEEATLFNALFVRQALAEDGGLYLEHLKTAKYIPAWREETFNTLAQARQEADFAPYLPTVAPEGYPEFEGHLNYQEGIQHTLWLRWSIPLGYDDVMISVYRDGFRSYHLVDPAEPETYDLRLYSIPWCDSVPEKYRETVDHPAFRAEDMSFSIVEARGREHDTGGMTYSFDVLHPDGTLVSFHCDGMTAQQVWELVEKTL